MSLKHKRDTEFLRGDLQSVESLLADLPAGAVLERAGFESRARELRAELLGLEGLPEPTFAQVDLLFGGDPVRGRDSIDAHFGSIALDAFQKAVVTAAAGGEVGARGPLADNLARLHITELIRGSMGFRLEEVGDQMLLPSRLHDAVDEVQALLRSLIDDSTDAFEDAVSAANPRVVGAVKEFVSTLKQSGAVCRVVSSGLEIALTTPPIVEAAAERISSYRVTEEDARFPGTLLGILPIGRRFEHRRDNGDVIRGRIAREVENPDALNPWLNQRCVVVARVTTIARPGDQQSVRYALRRLDPP